MSTLLPLRGFVILCDWTLVTTSLLFGAKLITLLFRKDAALRHLIWMIAFAAVLLLPVLRSFMPAHFLIRVPAPMTASFSPSSVAPDLKRTVKTQIPVLTTKERRTTMSQEALETVGVTEFQTDWTEVIVVLLGLWVAGVASFTVRGLYGIYGVAVIRRRSVKSALDLPYLTSLAAQMDLKRNWELRVSSTATPLAAMTWGVVRPVILLPRDSVTWSKDQLTVVLLHELAHVRRCDSLSKLLAVGVCAFCWFNPAVWFCARAMGAQAEMAADDAVLRSGIKPSVYATHLLQFAVDLAQRRQPFSSRTVSIINHHKIEGRIESIVDLRRRRREITLTEGIAALAVGCCILPLVASFQPVGFASRDSQMAAQSILALPGDGDHFHRPMVVVDTSRTVVGRSPAAPARVSTARDEKPTVQMSNLGRRPGQVGFLGNAEVFTDDSNVNAFRQADTGATKREEDRLRALARVDEAAAWRQQMGTSDAKEREADSDSDSDTASLDAGNGGKQQSGTELAIERMANSSRAMARADAENSRRQEHTKHFFEGDSQ